MCIRDRLIVFAAASLTETLTAIGETYSAENPGVTFRFNFDSSGTLKTQIQEGADCDLFISAGQKQMNQLDITASADVNKDGLDFVDADSRVNLLENKGGKAIGLCGIDGHMIQAEKQDERLGYVGEITKVNVAPILDVLEKGYIPVVSTVGCDSEGNTYNINADTAAARIAGELKAESFISMTDIAGILRNKDDDSTLISEIPVSDAPKLMREGIISGGMIPKVNCCIEAIRRGVRKVFIIDGRIPHAILIETLTDEGIGTMFITGNNYEHSKN